MKKYLRFFFGSPQRAVVTLGVTGTLALLEQVAPGTLGGALYALAGALIVTCLRIVTDYGGGILHLILLLLIVFFGFKILFKGWR